MAKTLNEVISSFDRSRCDLGPRAPAVGGRWTARRKAAVLEAIDTGRIGFAAALHEFGLTEAEIAAWRAARARLGLRGLKADGGRNLRRPS